MALTATRGSKFVIVLFLFFAGGGMVKIARETKQLGVESQNWPERRAKVISSEVLYSKQMSTHSPDIRCEYLDTEQVFEIKHFSYGWQLNTATSSKEMAEARVKEFPVGREVVVYACPDNWGKVITQKTYSFKYENTMQCVGIGLVLLAIASCFLKTVDSKKKNNEIASNA